MDEENVFRFEGDQEFEGNISDGWWRSALKRFQDQRGNQNFYLKHPSELGREHFGSRNFNLR